MLFTLREIRRTSGPVLFCLRRTSVDYIFTLDALALKPSSFCNVRVKPKLLIWNAHVPFDKTSCGSGFQIQNHLFFLDNQKTQKIGKYVKGQ